MLIVLQKLLKDIESLPAVMELDQAIKNGRRLISLGGLYGSSKSLVAAYACRCHLRPGLLITPDDEQAEKAFDDLKSFLGPAAVRLFPSWGISPYEIRAPHAYIIAQRLEALAELAATGSASTDPPVVTVAPVEALMEKTIPPSALKTGSLYIRKGKRLERDELISLLEKLNYRRTPMIEMLGEYSVRGGIVDVFPPTAEDPVRIEFFGDEIESLRHFSVLTQRSRKAVESVVILPRREVLFDVPLIEQLAERLDEKSAQALNVALSDGDDYDGLEFIWPKLGVSMSDLFAYLKPGTLAFIDDAEACVSRAEEFLESAHDKYESLNGLPAATPEEVFLSSAEIEKKLTSHIRIVFDNSGKNEAKRILFNTRPQESFGKNISYMKKRLSELGAKQYEINILCESRSHKERIGEIIDDIDIPVILNVAQISEGFAIPELKRWYLTDHQIFTRRRKRRTFKRFRESIPLSSYSSLNPGDYVVHIDYGIGQFTGLETLVVDGRKRDCLALLYFGGDKLFVPIEEFNRVQKYAGKDGAPRLSKLGSGTWEKVKQRTKKALMEMAGELIALYAERQAYAGFACKPDSDWMRQLEASFEFQETPDQLRAMDEIKLDMEKPSPMDRLICGDVGYGKTELAVRAALKAVDSGKQVAVLSPTTILTTQHYRTFTERLAQFPIKIAMLSRFCTAKQAQEVKAGLRDGTVDIVIGTHKLLAKNIEFRDLGLLIFDEEQRFGVAHKERLKKLKAHVDVLTLTATPIPRTLQFSLVGARDMSIINTPPKDRLPITTQIAKFSDKIITEAVNYELERGGQVFIVHNRVQSIYAFANYLKKLLPWVKICIGHGQMPERELEKVMRDFLDKKYQVLLSTTIIESGLDIPSVNTIIINRADKLGLAQLYQLRGRVGRSYQRARAYLLIPPLKLLTREARKRLKAIEEFTELGSGFQLAMKDLEIRGAGNLLGPQQHGFIEQIGFDLYIRLLEEAVAQLKGEPKKTTTSEIKITTDLDLFLPENYIPGSDQRVDIYKRFSAAEDFNAVTDLLNELSDRFGTPPQAAVNLASISAIKILGSRLGLKAMQLKKNRLSLEFKENQPIGRNKIERWVKAIPERIEFKYKENLRLDIKLKENDNQATKAKNILQKMAD